LNGQGLLRQAKASGLLSEPLLDLSG